ncbi:MAG: hypothetical protein M1438_09555 [Deltaproteobacteria bacterium]|nr:hypothetical protein [Deltaproteobacteria bacterium]
MAYEIVKRDTVTGRCRAAVPGVDYQSNRITSITSAASITPNADTTDIFKVSALAEDVTINAPTGTPGDGQKLIIEIVDDGSSRSISLDTAVYKPINVILPNATVPGKKLLIICMYDAIVPAAPVWDVVWVGQE